MLVFHSGVNIFWCITQRSSVGVRADPSSKVSPRVGCWAAIATVLVDWCSSSRGRPPTCGNNNSDISNQQASTVVSAFPKKFRRIRQNIDSKKTGKGQPSALSCCCSFFCLIYLNDSYVPVGIIAYGGLCDS